MCVYLGCDSALPVSSLPVFLASIMLHRGAMSESYRMIRVDQLKDGSS